MWLPYGTPVWAATTSFGVELRAAPHKVLGVAVLVVAVGAPAIPSSHDGACVFGVFVETSVFFLRFSEFFRVLVLLYSKILFCVGNKLLLIPAYVFVSILSE